MIKLTYSNADQRGDLARDGGNLLTDPGLETAVTISLFTDARAQEADGIDPRQDPRGWWGEALLDRPGPLGSRLWLVTRNKLTREALLQCAAHAEEALQWMMDAKIAASVQTEAIRVPGKTNAAFLTIRITRSVIGSPQFQRKWELQFGL